MTKLPSVVEKIVASSVIPIIGVIGAIYALLNVPRDIFERKTSKEFSESAIVVDILETPWKHFHTSSGIALSGGDAENPKRRSAVFECQHGKFSVEHPSVEELIENGALSKGQSVVIRCEEIYTIRMKANLLGHRKELGKMSVGYNLLGVKTKT